MSDGKRFKDSIYGFNKLDVNYYIEQLLKDFDDKLKAKDDEINSLRAQNKELKARVDELSSKAEEIDEMKDKVTQVLVKAQEKADLMLHDAMVKANEEKRKIEQLVESEKEKLVDIRSELKFLKDEVVHTLKKYEGQLTIMLHEEAG
jgi:cell division initiation protein